MRQKLDEIRPYVVKKQRNKQEVMVLEIPEWKLKIKIARNIIFEEN